MRQKPQKSCFMLFMVLRFRGCHLARRSCCSLRCDSVLWTSPKTGIHLKSRTTTSCGWMSLAKKTLGLRKVVRWVSCGFRQIDPKRISVCLGRHVLERCRRCRRSSGLDWGKSVRWVWPFDLAIGARRPSLERRQSRARWSQVAQPPACQPCWSTDGHRPHWSSPHLTSKSVCGHPPRRWSFHRHRCPSLPIRGCRRTHFQIRRDCIRTCLNRRIPWRMGSSPSRCSSPCPTGCPCTDSPPTCCTQTRCRPWGFRRGCRDRKNIAH